MRFWYRFCYHVVELFARVDAYTQTQVCYPLFPFANKTLGLLVSLLYILKMHYFLLFYLYFNTPTISILFSSLPNW